MIMRKYLLLLGALLFFMPSNASELINGLYYDFDKSDMTASVSSNRNFTGGDLIIPEKVEYNEEIYSVTSIGEDAFWGCSGLTSVEIPNSVTSIGFRAFSGCTGLTSVEIPNSVTSIGWYAFSGCTGLTSIEIPNSVTSIGYKAFSDCKGLTSVEISDIAAWCGISFDGDDSNPLSYAHNLYLNGELVTNLEIPNSVTSIGNYAFRGCSGLTSIVIPTSVISIGDHAFELCTGLTSVEIPNSVTSIGSSAFYYCSSLKSVEILNSVTSIGDHAFAYCEGLIRVTFGNSVTSIGEYAFMHCEGLTSVEIPNSVTSIGSRAFIYCYGLTSVQIPTSVTSIGSYAFYRCDRLKTLVLNIEELNPYLMEGWKYMSYFTDDIKVNKIEYLFNGSTIKNLIIPMGMERIVDYAFYKSEVLESVTFPDGFKEIGKAAFKDCPNLYNMQLPSSLTTLGDEAFAGCLSIYEVNLPSTLTSMGAGCFKGCQDLEKVTFAEGMTAIGDDTFNGCTRLQAAPLPNSITSIGDNAFYGCTGLQNVVFPENLERIGAAAYSGGVKIQDFKLPKSVAAIGDKAFSGTLDVTNLKLPEGLESVGSEAFLNCGIKTLSLPESLVFIGDRAFAGNSFTEVTIPGAMTEITYGAFNGCANLNTVNFNSSVTSIGDYAFARTAIRSLDIPAPVASIGSYAFSNSGIISVTFPETLASIGDNAFAGTQMVSFEIPNSVTSIGQNAFGNLHYLKMGTGFNDFTTHFCSGTDVLEMVSPTPPNLPTDRLGFTPNMVLVPEGAGAAYLANNRWKDYNIVAKNANKAVVYLNESGTLATEIRLQTGIMPGAVTNLTVEGAALNEADFAVIRSNMPACYDIDLSRVPNTVLNSGVFNGKGELLHVSLPKNLKEIGSGAFQNCYLATFDIPEGIESIGANAFANCESMDNDLVFGATLKSIGENAFSGCRSLKGADFSALDDISWGSGVFGNCYSLKNVTLPQNVTSIPSSMFANSGLERLHIPATAAIGNKAFDKCLSLVEVEFADGFRTLGSSLFTGCTALANVILPESVTTIGSQTFYGCTALQNIELPEGLEDLGQGAFGNSGLTGVVIPDAIQTIPESCFAGSSLVYVDMNGTKTIGSNAFSGCPNLLVVNLPHSLQTVNEGSLNSSNISAINSPTAYPAATAGNPFEKVDNATCALSIPKPSFTRYLGAEYWGKFVSIRNSIDITIETANQEGEIVDDTDDPAVELTYMEEEDYQEMLEELEEEGETPMMSRRRALHILRANGIAGINKGYGRLFNNASLFLDETAEMRFFLNLADDVTDFTVRYNGQDITNQVDRNTMSFVIKGLYSSSNLEISTTGHNVNGGDTSSIGSIGTEGYDENAPYYNLNGQIVKNPTPGIYIRGGRKVIVK